MDGVCGNENSELLRLLLEAKLVDQDMLKIPDREVSSEMKKKSEVLKLVDCNLINILSILACVCCVWFRGIHLCTMFVETITRKWLNYFLRLG